MNLRTLLKYRRSSACISNSMLPEKVNLIQGGDILETKLEVINDHEENPILYYERDK